MDVANSPYCDEKEAGMKHLKRITKLADRLVSALEDAEWLRVEVLARRFNESRADISRALKILGDRGWSFRRMHLGFSHTWTPKVLSVRKPKNSPESPKV